MKKKSLKKEAGVMTLFHPNAAMLKLKPAQPDLWLIREVGHPGKTPRFQMLTCHSFGWKICVGLKWNVVVNHLLWTGSWSSQRWSTEVPFRSGSLWFCILLQGTNRKWKNFKDCWNKSRDWIWVHARLGSFDPAWSRKAARLCQTEPLSLSLPWRQDTCSAEIIFKNEMPSLTYCMEKAFGKQEQVQETWLEAPEFWAAPSQKHILLVPSEEALRVRLLEPQPCLAQSHSPSPILDLLVPWACSGPSPQNLEGQHLEKYAQKGETALRTSGLKNDIELWMA